MTDGRRPWLKPELIVLVRNRPEEAVLAACKGGNANGPISQTEPGPFNQACRTRGAPCMLPASS
jgi:hypothetical protein